MQRPNSPFCPFVVNLDPQDLTSTFTCVQNFGRCSHFTQQSFISESGICMFSIASAGDVCARSAFDQWESVRLCCHVAVLSDLRRGQLGLLFGRIILRNKHERDFGLTCVMFSVVDDVMSQK